MKKIFKRAAVATLAVAVFTGGIAPPAAQAFSIGGLVGGLAKAALGIGGDVNSANQKMLENFYYSVSLMSAAYENVTIATGESNANRQLITDEQVKKNTVKSTDAGVNMKNGAEKSKQDAEKIQQSLKNALASGDEEKLKQIDEYMKEANRQRVLSDTMAGVAYTQAGFIVASQVTNAASGNVSNAVEGISNIIVVAKEVQDMLKVRNEISSAFKMATEEYRKTRGIKDPSKKEAKKAAEEIRKG